MSGSQRIMHSSARVPIARVVRKPAVMDGASVLFALVAVSAGLAYGHHARIRSVREDLPRERIVYSTRRPANWQLYFFGAGSSPKRITDDPALNYDATFSPDGRWVVFCSERSGNPHLYAIGLTHPGLPRQLTHGEFMDATPAFTPDGKSLLFVSDRERNADIFTMPFRPGFYPWLTTISLHRSQPYFTSLHSDSGSQEFIRHRQYRAPILLPLHRANSGAMR